MLPAKQSKKIAKAIACKPVEESQMANSTQSTRRRSVARLSRNRNALMLMQKVLALFAVHSKQEKQINGVQPASTGPARHREGGVLRKFAGFIMIVASPAKYLLMRASRTPVATLDGIQGKKLASKNNAPVGAICNRDERSFGYSAMGNPKRGLRTMASLNLALLLLGVLSMQAANAANPIAGDDTIVGAPGETVRFLLAHNDSDPDNHVLSTYALSGCAGAVADPIDVHRYSPTGSLNSVATSVYSFTLPATAGTTSCSYTVTDSNGESDTATITLVATNQVPTAVPVANISSSNLGTSYGLGYNSYPKVSEGVNAFTTTGSTLTKDFEDTLWGAPLSADPNGQVAFMHPVYHGQFRAEITGLTPGQLYEATIYVRYLDDAWRSGDGVSTRNCSYIGALAEGNMYTTSSYTEGGPWVPLSLKFIAPGTSAHIGRWGRSNTLNHCMNHAAYSFGTNQPMTADDFTITALPGSQVNKDIFGDGHVADADGDPRWEVSNFTCSAGMTVPTAAGVGSGTWDRVTESGTHYVFDIPSTPGTYTCTYTARDFGAETSTATGTITIQSQLLSCEVDHTGDDSGQACSSAAGDCSLRSAIEVLNAGNCSNHTVTFNIPGGGVQTISPAAGFAITQQGAVIDAETQPGSTCGGAQADLSDRVINVEIDAGNASILFDVKADATIHGFAIHDGTTAAIQVSDAQADAIVTCNYIGLKADGTTEPADSEPSYGIVIAQARSARIGGDTYNDANVILGHTQALTTQHPPSSIVDLDIRGNRFSTDRTGEVRLRRVVPGNLPDVSIATVSGTLQLGGATAPEKNVFGARVALGVGSTAFENANIVIEGNNFNVGLAGTASLGHHSWSLKTYLPAAGTTLRIGGDSVGQRNIFGGDGTATETTPIQISNSGTGATTEFTNNYVGVDVTGNSPLPVAGNGLGLQGAHNTTVKNNVFGNAAQSAVYTMAQSDNLTFTGNRVGIGADDVTVMGNGEHGLHLSAAIGVTVGDGTVAGRNIIVGNTDVGIRGVNLDNAVIDNNYIGIKADGTTPAGNGGVGISLFHLSQSVAILGNKISSNGDLGIDLSMEGVTANDAGDTDHEGQSPARANNGINYPVIDTAAPNGANIDIQFDLDINDGTHPAYRIEFFLNDADTTGAIDASGHGEGEIFLGSTVVTGDVTDQQVSFAGPAGFNTSDFVSATATACDNATCTSTFKETSEFSGAKQIDNGPEISGRVF